jgi:hypothetical protein
MYKEACSLQCIYDLIRLFYKSHSWTIAAKSHLAT